MSLRLRLALTLLLISVPLLASLAWLRREGMRRAELDGLRELVATRISSLGRDRCEAAPEDFLPIQPPPRPGPGPGGMGPPGRRHGPPPMQLRAYVYDGAFRAKDPAAPQFPASLRHVLAKGDAAVSERSSTRGGSVLRLAVRTSWAEGPCSVVLAEREGREPPLLFDVTWTALPVLALALASVLLAAGPLVRRIRSLTAEIRRSADARYANAVRVGGRDEIAELARAFNDASAQVRAQIDALDQRDRTLRAFLASTTHDVMIPLTVLQGHLSELRQRRSVESATDDPRLVAAMSEAHYLASLIHNLGVAAKLDSGEPLAERHPVDLGALVERVVERHRPVAVPAGVSIDFGVPEAPVIVAADVTLLEQAVSNLVHNAVRYNRRGGHVAVVLDTPAPGFRLRVIDDGPGIDAAELPRLLKRRERGDQARQREPGGSGLGLHIAAGVAERLGLELRLVRAEGGGLEAALTGPTSGP